MSVTKSRSLKTVLLMTAMLLSGGTGAMAQEHDYYSYGDDTLTYGGSLQYGEQVIHGEQLTDELPKDFGRDPVVQAAAPRVRNEVLHSTASYPAPARSGGFDVGDDGMAYSRY